MLQSCEIVTLLWDSCWYRISSVLLITFSTTPIHSVSPAFSINVLRSSSKPEAACIKHIFGTQKSTLTDLVVFLLPFFFYFLKKNFLWCCGVEIIANLQLHSKKFVIRFCADSNLAFGLSKVCDDENIQQGSRLEIKFNALASVNHSLKGFININLSPSITQ